MMDITNLADALGLSNGATTLLLLCVLIVIGYIFTKIKNEQTRIKFLTISILSVFVLLGLSGSFLSFEQKGLVVSEEDAVTEAHTAWQEEYAERALNVPTYSEDIANTEYYDYNSKVINATANRIARESSSAKEAVKKSLELVYQVVDYNQDESDVPCMQSSAPLILESGTGQCDTQSIALVSILRRMGIIARPVGGCIVSNPACKFQALYQSVLGFREPKFTPVDIIEGEDEFSRAGGLHAYVVAWLPDEGWIPLEPTAGKFADTKCYYYHVELYPENDERQDICKTDNIEYAKACQISDMNSLDQNGLGLVTEVEP